MRTHVTPARRPRTHRTANRTPKTVVSFPSRPEFVRVPRRSFHDAGAVMKFWDLFMRVCGYERVGDQLRLYVDSPEPVPSVNRERGVRSVLFYLFAGRDAEAVIEWLDRNKAWQVLRGAPAFTTARGVRAVLLADNWHGGEGSGMLRLARTRVIADDAHREQLRREVRLLIGMVIENPVRNGELQELQLVEDVANTAPLGVALCSTAQVVDAYFGTGG